MHCCLTQSLSWGSYMRADLLKLLERVPRDRADVMGKVHKVRERLEWDKREGRNVVERVDELGELREAVVDRGTARVLGPEVLLEHRHDSCSQEHVCESVCDGREEKRMSEKR